MKYLLTIVACISSASITSGYSFVPSRSSINNAKKSISHPRTSSKSTQLKMVDTNTILGGAIALAGVGAGIGLVAFTEGQGERAKERGSTLSDSMSTKMAGNMMDDIEVSSVADVSSLTSQLEQALKETGGVKNEETDLTGKILLYNLMYMYL